MRYSTDKFTHDKVAKTFTAESSDLEHGWTNGITLVSPRGTTASFFIKEVHRCGTVDNEITHWTLTCSTNERVLDYKIIIFND